MKVEIKNHLLFIDGEQVPFYDTPNKSSKTMTPEFIIEHYTADSKPSSTIGWFMDKAAVVSAHLLIDREGKVYQFGKFTTVLWHAGASKWLNYTSMNSHSIGIEMTNLGRCGQRPDAVKLTHKNESSPAWWQTYTDVQIDACAAVTKALVDFYKLKDVLGHEDVSPGRKSDPGPAFPWAKIKPAAATNVFTVTASELNLREFAGAEFKVLTTIPNGTRLTELQRQDKWSQVTYKGFTGWVSNTYLKK